MSLTPTIYSSTQHSIQTRDIDVEALDIILELKNFGYQAFLVGGSIRDLLMGGKPKDFDISTSATPEQIKRVFGRRCRLIGRRFLLAHVHLRGKVYEIATFRSGDNTDGRLITHDNQWGTPAQDAARRDFTINALYYDPQTEEIIDYCNGYQDIQDKTLRVIGDPVIRFQQDPVRMIRLIKFKARFDLKIEQTTLDALLSCKKEILKSSTARVQEEISRMLESGYSTPFIQLMLQSGILELLQPEINAFLQDEVGPVLYKFTRTADYLIREKKVTFDRAVLVCCLLFPMVDELIQRRFVNKGEKIHLGHIIQIVREVIDRVIGRTFVSFPQGIRYLASLILEFQYRIKPFHHKPFYYQKIVEHPEFSFALQFFYIRSYIYEDLRTTYDKWKKQWHTHKNYHDHRRTKSIRAR